MDKKIVQQVILETLDAVNDQVKMITDYNGKIPWIEIDITKDYLRTLYENVLVLERYNGIEENNPAIEPKKEKEIKVEKNKTKDVAFEPVKEEEKTPEKESSPVVEDIPLEKQPEPEVDVVTSVEKEEVVEVPEKKEETPDTEPVAEQNAMIEEQVPEPEKEPEQESEQEPEPGKIPETEVVPEPVVIPEPVVAPEPVKEKVEVKEKPEKKEPKTEPKKKEVDNGTTIADKLNKVEKKSLGETIQNGENTLGDNIGKKPIRKLKSVIGINDKFSFVNDLFHGTLKDYTETISALDEAASPDEADAILKAQQEKQNWDTNGDAYKKLKDFVDRKFIIH